MSISIEVFLTPEALAINDARQQHLAALGLDLSGKRVLEVGAGIGLHTQFFEARGCAVLTTDGRADNVAEIQARYPNRNAQVLDLEATTDLSHLGTFDVVYCYGTLYHLAKPEQALQALAQICQGLILIETCVTPGDEIAVNLEAENRDNPNQAFSGIGCRPTRPWVLQTLRNYFGFAYISRYQPCHPDFDLDWAQPKAKNLHRAVFVGSKHPLENAKLLEVPLQQQQYDPQLRAAWVQTFLQQPEPHNQVETLELGAVIDLAEVLATARPLEPYPGWYFNIEWNSPDPTVRLRQAIWNYFRRHQMDVAIQMPWHHDLQLILYMGNDLSSQLFIAGCYEPNELYLLSQVLSPGMTVVDVGANDGLYALYAAKQVGDRGRVIAIEPSLREFQRLQAQIALNSLPQIQALQIAASDHDGMATLKIATAEHAGQNTLGEFIYEGVASEHSEAVEVTALDTLIHRLELVSVDVIKIDTEGAELAVLQGSEQILERDHPLLLLELSDEALQAQGSSSAAVLQFLRSRGYIISRFSPFLGLAASPPADRWLSNNIIAHHPSRTWPGLSAAELAERSQIDLNQCHLALEQTQTNLAQLQVEQHQLQAQLTETQDRLHDRANQLAHTQTLLAQSQTLAAQVDPLTAEVASLRTEQAALHQQLQHTQAELQRSQAEIAAMKTSKFWKLREAWISLKRTSGLEKTP